MKKNEQIKLIERLFDALKYAQIGQIGWSDYWRRMVAIIEKSEKEHRSSPLARPCGITVKTATKLFAVRYVIEHRAGKWTDEKGHEHKPYVPRIEDILGTRLECFQGYAIWRHDRKKICKAVSKADALDFVRHVDYAKLMEVSES